MSRRRRGTGHGLVRDVTEVGHGKSAAIEGRVEVLQANAGLHRRRSRLRIDRQHPVVPAELDEVADCFGLGSHEPAPTETVLEIV